jgi:hypothetical protein
MMATERRTADPIRTRLGSLVQRGEALEAEGVPFPSAQIHDTVERALATGSPQEALQILSRGETLLTKTSTDWSWVKELLRRDEEMRGIANAIGVDLAHLDARVGNPRKTLQSQPLSTGSLERAAASASLALAVLSDAIPKFCVQEAQQLGVSVRQARNRGEEVGNATRAFSRLLQAIQDQNLPTAATRLAELRKMVARIPRAPTLPPLSENEEEEILLEARMLARRLQRIKSKARDAPSAARLMTQVRAALSEDRRYGTPEEEIDALWLEVDRLTQQRKIARAGPPLAAPREEEDLPEESDADEEENEPHPPLSIPPPTLYSVTSDDADDPSEPIPERTRRRPARTSHP